QGRARRSGRPRRDTARSLAESKSMPKKQPIANGFVLFYVRYEDGTQTSNRRVPAAELGGLDGDLPAKAIVEMQDRKIARCRAFRAHAFSPLPARAKREGRFPARGGILGGCCPIAPLAPPPSC